MRQNRCVNPKCDNNVTGWTNLDPSRFTLSRVASANFPGATHAARITRDTSGDFPLLSGYGAAVPADGVFTLSAYCYPNITSNGTLYLDEYDDAMVYRGSPFSTALSLPANTLTRVSITGDLTATNPATTRIMLNFQTGGGFAGDYIEVSQVLIENVGTLGSYKDGDSASWEWDGADGNSASSEVANPAATLTWREHRGRGVYRE